MTTEDLFHQANRAYRHGEFAHAVTLYTRLLRFGAQSGAHRNAGLAEARRARNGAALYHLHRAMWLAPGQHHDLRPLIQRLRASGPMRHTTMPMRLRLRESLPPTHLQYLALACALLALGATIARRWTAGLAATRGVQALAGLCTALAVLAGGLSFADAYQRQDSRWGVVIPDRAFLRAAPRDDAHARTAVRAGQWLKLAHRRGYFRQACSRSRQCGWIRMRDAKAVENPS